jgi:hypothetical protein
MDRIYGIMIACVILHNMITDNKKGTIILNHFLLRKCMIIDFQNIHGRHSKAREFLITFQFEIKLGRTIVDHEGGTTI